jgi:hypothetical protein
VPHLPLAAVEKGQRAVEKKQPRPVGRLHEGNVQVAETRVITEFEAAARLIGLQLATWSAGPLLFERVNQTIGRLPAVTTT